MLIRHCGSRLFTLPLPSSTLLTRDFIHAANGIATATELRDVSNITHRNTSYELTQCRNMQWVQSYECIFANVHKGLVHLLFIIRHQERMQYRYLDHCCASLTTSEVYKCFNQIMLISAYLNLKI